jgi:hypothetical protein
MSSDSKLLNKEFQFDAGIEVLEVEKKGDGFFITAPLCSTEVYPEEILKSALGEANQQLVLISHGKTKFGDSPIGKIREVYWDDVKKMPMGKMEIFNKTEAHRKVREELSKDITKSVNDRTFKGISIGGVKYFHSLTKEIDSVLITEASLAFNPVCKSCIIEKITQHEIKGVTDMSGSEITPTADTANPEGISNIKLEEKLITLESELTKYGELIKEKDQIIDQLKSERIALSRTESELRLTVEESTKQISELKNQMKEFQTIGIRSEIVKHELGSLEGQEATTRLEFYKSFEPEQLGFILEGHQRSRPPAEQPKLRQNPIQLDLRDSIPVGTPAIAQKRDPKQTMFEVLERWDPTNSLLKREAV